MSLRMRALVAINGSEISGTLLPVPESVGQSHTLPAGKATMGRVSTHSSLSFYRMNVDNGDSQIPRDKRVNLIR